MTSRTLLTKVWVIHFVISCPSINLWKSSDRETMSWMILKLNDNTKNNIFCLMACMVWKGAIGGIRPSWFVSWICSAISVNLFAAHQDGEGILPFSRARLSHVGSKGTEVIVQSQPLAPHGATQLFVLDLKQLELQPDTKKNGYSSSCSDKNEQWWWIWKTIHDFGKTLMGNMTFM